MNFKTINRFWACILFTVLVGCTTVSTHTGYTYTKVEKEIEYGVFEGKILGKMRRVDNKRSVEANPYTLIMSLSLNPEVENSRCYLSIKSMELINDETKEIVLIRDFPNTEFELGSLGDIYSSFFIDDVRLSHVGHTLTFEYIFSENCNVDNDTGTINMQFEKIYKVIEYNLWDIIFA